MKPQQLCDNCGHPPHVFFDGIILDERCYEKDDGIRCKCEDYVATRTVIRRVRRKARKAWRATP